jgi:hypothetical protein
MKHFGVDPTSMGSTIECIGWGIDNSFPRDFGMRGTQRTGGASLVVADWHPLWVGFAAWENVAFSVQPTQK